MTESIRYEETGRMGEIEFRRYPPLILATVSGADENEVFMILFRYISGNNRPGNAVPMTAPVLTPVKIAMTTPVVSDGESMSFIMPATYKKEDVPDPLDPRVRIEEIPGRDVAVIRFRGRAPARDIRTVRARLLKSLEEAQVQVTGIPFLMRYNPPFTPGFLRRNEVAVEIRRS